MERRKRPKYLPKSERSYVVAQESNHKLSRFSAEPGIGLVLRNLPRTMTTYKVENYMKSFICTFVGAINKSGP